jgi:hypothetical protein
MAGSRHGTGLGVRSENHSSRPPRPGGGKAEEDAAAGRIRKKEVDAHSEQSRRRPCKRTSSTLLQECSVGDAMRVGALWINPSLREWSRQLLALAIPASRRTIRRATA